MEECVEKFIAATDVTMTMLQQQPSWQTVIIAETIIGIGCHSNPYHLHNTDNMTDINQVTQVAKGVSDYGMMVEIHYGKNKNILT